MISLLSISRTTKYMQNNTMPTKQSFSNKILSAIVSIIMFAILLFLCLYIYLDILDYNINLNGNTYHEFSPFIRLEIFSLIKKIKKIIN